MKRILLIDNYDSFTYNLFHYLEELSDAKVFVLRNDELEQLTGKEFDAFVISPGPGLPNEAGVLMPFLNQFLLKKNCLGVCLGHQAIAQYFGMELMNLKEVVHGMAKEISINFRGGLFKSLPSKQIVGRYHSWVINPKTTSKEFHYSAHDLDGNIMAMEHKTLPIIAVQFHPESVLSPFGKQMLTNWLKA